MMDVKVYRNVPVQRIISCIKSFVDRSRGDVLRREQMKRKRKKIAMIQKMTLKKVAYKRRQA